MNTSLLRSHFIFYWIKSRQPSHIYLCDGCSLFQIGDHVSTKSNATQACRDDGKLPLGSSTARVSAHCNVVFGFYLFHVRGLRYGNIPTTTLSSEFLQFHIGACFSASYAIALCTSSFEYSHLAQDSFSQFLNLLYSWIRIFHTVVGINCISGVIRLLPPGVVSPLWSMNHYSI